MNRFISKTLLFTLSFGLSHASIADNNSKAFVTHDNCKPDETIAVTLEARLKTKKENSLFQYNTLLKEIISPIGAYTKSTGHGRIGNVERSIHDESWHTSKGLWTIDHTLGKSRWEHRRPFKTLSHILIQPTNPKDELKKFKKFECSLSSVNYGDGIMSACAIKIYGLPRQLDFDDGQGAMSIPEDLFISCQPKEIFKMKVYK